MTFDEVVNTIENIHRFGKATGREVTEELTELLGHPEAGMKTIHIAGTNGKGSTSAFISSILMDADFSVGTFTSPHLVDFRERITVNGEMIPKEDVARLGSRLLSLDMKLQPTMFDYCLGIALLYFKEKGVDYVVLETGLGGAKDSTAGLSTVPVVSVITRIGLDHTAILGDSIEKIATEKAGIIKAGTGLVVAKNETEAEKVILDAGLRVQAQSVSLNSDLYYEDFVKDIELGIKGKYQKENAATAVATVKLLSDIDEFNLPDEVILSGLRKAAWAGRMEVLSENPFFLVDGAHNPQGVKALYESLMELYPDEKFTFILGVLADKDYEEMIDMMIPLAKSFNTVTVESDRAVQGERLANIINDKGISARYFNDLEEALVTVLGEANDDERVIAFGSLYFIGSIKEKVAKLDEFR